MTFESTRIEMKDNRMSPRIFPWKNPRAHPVVLHLDPGALERHHGAVELLPREGPRPPRLGAGRLAASLPREARRDAVALLLDGCADGGADPDRLRGRVQGWCAVRAVRAHR